MLGSREDKETMKKVVKALINPKWHVGLRFSLECVVLGLSFQNVHGVWPVMHPNYNGPWVSFLIEFEGNNMVVHCC